MNQKSSRWQTEELSKTYLEGVREAIPLAKEQIEMILTLVSRLGPEPCRIIDLGCGDGILGRTLLERFPNAALTLIDFSEPMLKAAREKAGDDKRIKMIKGDFSSPKWLDAIEADEGIDLIVSGFSIHHQSDERKREIYEEIFHLLSPGGIFLNLEHVASATPAIEALFDDYFIDHLYKWHLASKNEITREIVEGDYYSRPDKVENILALVEDQCRWLREIGFKDVDCFFKLLEVGLFGGRKGA